MVFSSWKNERCFSIWNTVQSSKMQGMSYVSSLSSLHDCQFCVRVELCFLESPFLCGSGLEFADDKSFPGRHKMEMGSHYFFKGVCSQIFGWIKDSQWPSNRFFFFYNDLLCLRSWSFLKILKYCSSSKKDEKHLLGA